MIDKTVVISQNICDEVEHAIDGISPDKVFVLYDSTTHECCSPLLEGCRSLQNATSIQIPATDVNKTLDTLSAVWMELSNGGASRRSLLINVGGGMVTDLGGFAASTFKRGIAYINIPTTLLAMVDASVGGKTAINFNGLKNEVGVFNAPARVIVDTQFLRTLDIKNMLSGYAEMIKHGLISSTGVWADIMNFDMGRADYGALQKMVADSIDVKAAIVANDPKENGLRKALNVGHTAGHAIESLALMENRPVLHGYAVAWGMVCELYLSRVKKGFPQGEMNQTIRYIKENYGTFDFGCDKYEKLYSLMQHDKKNVGGVINFTLLSGIGKIELDCTADKDEIFAMLDFFREALN